MRKPGNHGVGVLVNVGVGSITGSTVVGWTGTTASGVAMGVGSIGVNVGWTGTGTCA